MGQHYIKNKAMFPQSEVLDSGKRVLFLIHNGATIYKAKQAKIYLDFKIILTSGGPCHRVCSVCPYRTHKDLCNILRTNGNGASWDTTRPVVIYGKSTTNTVHLSPDAVAHLRSIADSPANALRLVMDRYRRSKRHIEPVRLTGFRPPITITMYTSEWDELKRLREHLTLPCIIDAIVLADARGEFV